MAIYRKVVKRELYYDPETILIKCYKDFDLDKKEKVLYRLANGRPVRLLDILCVVDWEHLIKYNKLTVSFIDKFKDYIDWFELSKEHFFTERQLLNFKDYIDWGSYLYNNMWRMPDIKCKTLDMLLSHFKTLKGVDNSNLYYRLFNNHRNVFLKHPHLILKYYNRFSYYDFDCLTEIFSKSNMDLLKKLHRKRSLHKPESDDKIKTLLELTSN